MIEYIIFSLSVFILSSLILAISVLILSRKYKLHWLIALVAVFVIISFIVFAFNFYDFISGFASLIG